MNSLDLSLQPLGTGAAADGLAALLVSPASQSSFVVCPPPTLLSLHQAWLRRFLQHHHPGQPVPAHVVAVYGQQLVAALGQWFHAPEWAPLQRAMKMQPGRPLRIRVGPSLRALEQLPWEALPLDRSIWRLAPTDPALPMAVPRQRRPRLLLVVGHEGELRLDREIEELEGLARRGRIALITQRGSEATAAQLRTALEATPGWDMLIFLGHSSGDRQGSGSLQLGDGSWISGGSLEPWLRRAADQGLQLVLLNSCSGVDLAHRCMAAGIAWVQCFREPVPSEAATAAFTTILRQMEAGRPFGLALEAAAHQLQQGTWAGVQWLMSAYCHPEAQPFQLPEPRQRLQRLELLLLGAGTGLTTVAGVASGWGARGVIGRREWRMATYLGAGDQALLVAQAPRMVAERVDRLTSGRFRIRLVHVPQISTSQMLKRVNGGGYECSYGDIYYDKLLQPLIFAKAIPFGLSPREQTAWLHYFRAGEDRPFHQSIYPRLRVEGVALDNLRTFPITCTGGQMGGWFKKEINDLQDLVGLRMRIPGLGAEILNRFQVRTDFELNEGRIIPPGELVSRLRNGKLDAAEWIGPHDDEALGLYRAAKYYYYPGWWEPSTTTELVVNARAFRSLPPDHQAALEVACAETYTQVFLQYDLQNMEALERLRRRHGVELRRFSDSMLAAFERQTVAHLEELARQSPDTFGYAYKEWLSFRDRFRATTRITQYGLG